MSTATVYGTSGSVTKRGVARTYGEVADELAAAKVDFESAKKTIARYEKRTMPAIKKKLAQDRAGLEAMQKGDRRDYPQAILDGSETLRVQEKVKAEQESMLPSLHQKIERLAGELAALTKSQPLKDTTRAKANTKLAKTASGAGTRASQHSAAVKKTSAAAASRVIQGATPEKPSVSGRAVKCSQVADQPAIRALTRKRNAALADVDAARKAIKRFESQGVERLAKKYRMSLREQTAKAQRLESELEVMKAAQLSAYPTTAAPQRASTTAATAKPTKVSDAATTATSKKRRAVDDVDKTGANKKPRLPAPPSSTLTSAKKPAAGNGSKKQRQVQPDASAAGGESPRSTVGVPKQSQPAAAPSTSMASTEAPVTGVAASSLPPAHADSAGAQHGDLADGLGEAKKASSCTAPPGVMAEAGEIAAYEASTGEANRVHSRKRPAEDGEAIAPPPKKSAPSPKAPAPAPTKRTLKGLSNVHQACFANAALHVIDTAFSDEHVSVLHADDAGRPQSFGVSEEKLRKTHDPSTQSRERKTLLAELKALQARIEAATTESQTPLAEYLGQLLKALRANPSEAPSSSPEIGHISPCVLQRVFAYSRKSRHRLDGDETQDASEWLLTLLDEVSEARPALRALFEVQQATEIECECGFKHAAPPTPAEISFNVLLPDEAQLDTVSLPERISKALDAKQLYNGYTCEDCSALDTTKQRQIFTKLPDNLIVLIDRIHLMHQTKKTTPLGLEFGEIPIGDERYRMVAMIRHTGRYISNGHYVAFRKHQGEWWELDDQNVRQVEESALADQRHGHSSVLLLQKVQR